MISTTTFLDLKDVFFNEIIGDVTLGVIIGLLLIWIFSAKKNMPLKLSLYFGILWLAVFTIGYPELLIIRITIVLAVGFTFYYSLSKALNRGG